jgi:hypothetical protein
VENPDDCGSEIELLGPVTLPRRSGSRLPAEANAWYTFSLCKKAGCQCSGDKTMKKSLNRQFSSVLNGQAPATDHKCAARQLPDVSKTSESGKNLERDINEKGHLWCYVGPETTCPFSLLPTLEKQKETGIHMYISTWPCPMDNPRTTAEAHLAFKLSDKCTFMLWISRVLLMFMTVLLLLAGGALAHFVKRRCMDMTSEILDQERMIGEAMTTNKDEWDAFDEDSDEEPNRGRRSTRSSRRRPRNSTSDGFSSSSASSESDGR